MAFSTLHAALSHQAARRPDHPAVVGDAAQWTWSQLADAVEHESHRFADAGIAPGDVVGVCVSRRPEIVVAYLALAHLGAIAVPVNHKLEPRHNLDLLATTGMTALVLEARFDGEMDPVAPRLSGPVFYVGPTGRLLRRGEAGRTGTPTDVCYLNVTSGSTGRPKAAITTHAQILANAEATVTGLGFREDDVFLCLFSAFAHPHEIFHRALLTGATMVAVDTLSPRVVADAVRRHGVTWIMAVPSFYEMLLDLGEPLPTLRVMEAGGAWCPPERVERLERAYHARFVPVWGSTETTGVVLAPTGTSRTPGATGRVLPPYEISIRDSRGRELPDGTPGEMWVRGPGVVAGYLGMPDETNAAFSLGWYRTSDLVRREPDGTCWFEGRLTEMLKVGGIRVFPLEIERVLHTHPDVAEAVVVRAEERVRGEVPRAVVRTRAGSHVTAQDLRSHCRAHLAVYKVPRLLELWDELPHLPNGKVDRQAIAARPPV